MSYTKLQLVQAALVEIGLANYLLDLSTTQLDSCLARLDAMMAEWNGRGIRLGYNVEARPTDINGGDDSGIPDVAYEAVITNLAVRIAPSIGRSTSGETRATAARGLNTLLAIKAKPKATQLGPMLAGAGAKSSTPFISEQTTDKLAKPEKSSDFG